MMGVNHAISGAAAWVLVASTADNFPALGMVDVEPWQLITGAIVCAGAALLPDADHHNATIAHSVPVLGAAAAGAAGALSGGHRHGMHSLLAILSIWFLTGWAGALTWQPDWWYRPIPVAVAIGTAATLTFAVKVLRLARGWGRAWLIGTLAAAGIALFLPDQIGWFQLCITVGYAAHIVGDWLTVEGINWFWPLKLRAPKAVAATPVLGLIWKENGYFSLPILGRTGSIAEHLLGAGLGIYAISGLAANLMHLAL